MAQHRQEQAIAQKLALVADTQRNSVTPSSRQTAALSLRAPQSDASQSQQSTHGSGTSESQSNLRRKMARRAKQHREHAQLSERSARMRELAAKRAALAHISQIGTTKSLDKKQQSKSPAAMAKRIERLRARRGAVPKPTSGHIRSQASQKFMLRAQLARQASSKTQ